MPNNIERKYVWELKKISVSRTSQASTSNFQLFGSGTSRPLKTIARISGDVYIPRGVSAPALDNDILWEFQPKKVGSLTQCNLPLLKPKRSQVMDGVLSQAQEMLCNAWRGTCSPNVECGMENLLPYAFVFGPPTNNYSLKAEGTSAESIATISKVNIVKRRMEAAYETLQGSVFEDVKCKDVVEFERIRLELEEIVKLFTNGEIYLKRQAMTAYVVTLPLKRSWDMAFQMSPYSKSGIIRSDMAASSTNMLSQSGIFTSIQM
ncbi:V-type proton ATPase catalytic subunit A [Artemisia annua]|uniref:V-type proton ATPase catalytic subunit A n=1 Tax=Artemisia annua TaxID=35608 RepID=A0A2U1NDH4_ARTAN|nr:V-type proton ATPase catalytic subunit A [Artemisia annua]